MKSELKTENRDSIFNAISAQLREMNFAVTSYDFERPWGGFFVIDEIQAPQFAKQFFPNVDLDSLRISGKLSPKILVVEPFKRLSWQYHHRRAEIWKCVSGNVGVVTSLTDEETDIHQLTPGQEIRLAQGQRHRLVGLDGWGVLAEIWQHTDVTHPSDENDIVRVQDDYGR